MAMPTYKAIAFISDDSAFSVSGFAQRLQSLPNASEIRVSGVSNAGLKVSFEDWSIRMLVDTGGYVPEEARENAKDNSSYPHAAKVGECRRMAAIWSDDPDPDMDHFNDYLLVVETLARSFAGVFAQDTASGQWFDAM